MTLWSSLGTAIHSLHAHRVRSLLTCFGIVVGIGTVIAVVSAGRAASRELDDFLEDLGKNVILVRPGTMDQDVFAAYGIPLTMDDVEAIRQRAATDLVGVAPSQALPAQVTTRTERWTTLLTGTTPELQTIRRWVLTQGRFFNQAEVKQEAAVAVLGARVAQELFKSNQAIGQFVRINNTQFRVIGVLQTKGKIPTGFDQDDQVFLPITTLQERLAQSKDLTLIAAAARATDRIEPAMADIREAMREKRRLKPGAPDPFDVSSVQEMSGVAVTVTSTMQVLVGVLAGISLFIGGLGIMNVMLASVAERTREIGVRISLGATTGQVLMQFVLEGAVLALVGGILGVTVGGLTAAMLSHLAGWPFDLSPVVVTLALVVAGVDGIVLSYYPARRAALLDPVAALQHD
jgi:putative ABC transport system permease protein